MCLALLFSACCQFYSNETLDLFLNDLEVQVKSLVYSKQRFSPKKAES